VTQDVSTTGYGSPGYGPPLDGSPSDESTSTPQVAKEQAGNVAGSAKDAGQHVAGVAKEQAGNVASEAKNQAANVVGQARDEISRQAADQQQRVAGGLRSIGSELGSMAERTDESGVAGDLARQASAKAHEVADWLDQRDPSALLDEVKSFARRRPGAFLAIAVGAGLVAGRLTRGLKDESSGPGSTPSQQFSGATPAQPVGPYGSSGSYGSSESYGAGQPVGSTAAFGDAQTVGSGQNLGSEQAFGSDQPVQPATGYGETTYDEVEVIEVVEPAYPTATGQPYRDEESSR
jgi:hypothetical protein